MNPSVDILMPVHNGQDFVRAAIESILSQSVTNWKLFVIDDASEDQTWDTVNSYSDSRIKIIRNGTRRGIAVSLNRAIAETRAPFVARMDADDISRSDRLSQQLSIMNAEPSLSICGSWLKCCPAGARPYTLRYPTGSDCIASYILFGNPLAHPSVMIRRSILDRGYRYDESVSVAQDLELWSRVLPVERAENVPMPLLKYRVHPAATTVARAVASDAVTRGILNKQLKKLGFDLNNQEMLFHRVVGHGAGARTTDELVRMERWLSKIIDRNAELRVFPEAGLRQAAGFLWMRICANSAFLGVSAWRLCRRFSLRMDYRASRAVRINFAARILRSMITGDRHPQGWLPEWARELDAGVTE